MPTPNLAGYREAQDRLRTQLGTDVTFLVPTDPAWAAGVELDPETQRPYDPFAVPTAGTGEPLEVVKRATVSQGFRQEDQAELSPRGPVASDRIQLNVAVVDWPDITDATHAVVFGERFKITEARAGGLTQPARYLIWAVKG